ncbi:MAG: bacteriocin propeptide, family [Clostridiales bacterium]|nr:bacteriocin propeptide, family [Clostridiales bacterium]
MKAIQKMKNLFLMCNTFYIKTYKPLKRKIDPIKKGGYTMSVVSAKAFIEKVKNDEGFKKKLAALKDAKARAEFVKAAGYDFTKEELAKVKEEQGLSDDELDNVAGGCGHACLEGIGDVSIW